MNCTHTYNVCNFTLKIYAIINFEGHYPLVETLNKKVYNLCNGIIHAAAAVESHLDIYWC